MLWPCRVDFVRAVFSSIPPTTLSPCPAGSPRSARTLGGAPSPHGRWRAFFSTRFVRILDASGYARLKHWRIYAEEGLARSEVALWLGAESLTVEFAGDTLARYDADYSARSNELREVGRPRLFETVHRRTPAQPRLFELVVLGDSGWLKALRKEQYAPRKPRRPQALQQVLFSYIEAV